MAGKSCSLVLTTLLCLNKNPHFTYTLTTDIPYNKSIVTLSTTVMPPSLIPIKAHQFQYLDVSYLIL